MNSLDEKNSRPVIFGEVLFDHFLEGEKYLGGAPFNVAWHLQGFGLRPLFVSRIGQDSDGEVILAEMVKWGMDTQAIQIDPSHATGNVQISIRDNEPEFIISEDQAWDNISSALVIEIIRNHPCSLLYFGSLAQRGHVSATTLKKIIAEIHLPMFIDINLRSPWQDEAVITQCLQSANWLKINEEELNTVTMSTNLSVVAQQQVAELLRRQNDIETVFLTRGDEGAITIDQKGILQVEAAKPDSRGDSVGAGDAFSAVCILGLHLKWSRQQMIERANAFAAKICGYTGALPLQKSDYDDYIEKWS